MMKIEDLKTIGLDEEQIKQVMALKGKAMAAMEQENKTLRESQEKAERDVNALRTLEATWASEKSTLEKEVKEARQLAQNSARENPEKEEEWKRKYETLEKELENEKQKTASMHLTSQIKDALGAYKPKNAVALMKLLDRDAITQKGDALHGLKEQIEKLKETDAYLFEDVVPEKGGTHIEGGSEQKFDMNAAIRAAANR